MNKMPWNLYSTNFISRIIHPCHGGRLTEKEAHEQSLFLAIGKSGSITTGNSVIFYFFVNPNGGSIQEARFQVYGDSALIGACEVISELVLGKTYQKAYVLTIQDIDQKVRDTIESPSFPKNTYGHIMLALYALQDAMGECTHIPLPVANSPFQETKGLWPNWESLPHEEQLAAIEQVLTEEVRPMISQDSGGVELLSFEGKEVQIAYTGACVNCMSSTGSTLSYILGVLRSRIHPEISIRL